MQPYNLIAIVDEKRRILIDLPEEIPEGFVEITLRAVNLEGLQPSETNFKRLEAKQFAEELLRTAMQRPSNISSLSAEEVERLLPLLGD